MSEELKLWQALKACEKGEKVEWWSDDCNQWLPFASYMNEGSLKDWSRIEIRLAPEKTPAEEFLERFPIGTMVTCRQWKFKPHMVEAATYKAIYFRDPDDLSLSVELEDLNKRDWREWTPPEKKKQLMTPELLADKWVLKRDNGHWVKVVEIFGANHVWLSDKCGYTLENLFNACQGWADHPTAELNESFEVEE